MTGGWDRDALQALLEELSVELGRAGARAQIYVIGGAAMSLGFDRRRATHDVDARIETGHGALTEAVRRVARRRGLAESWLNEQATASIPRAPDGRAGTLYESEYLTVTGASAEHVLAMKLEAGRDTDVADTATLMRHLGLTTPGEAMAIHARLFPESRRSERAAAVAARALGDATGSRTAQGPNRQAQLSPEVGAMARKIEVARSEVGPGRVEMSAQAGRLWARYVSATTPTAARWLGAVTNAETLARAMHAAGEIDETAIEGETKTLDTAARARARQAGQIQP